MRELLATLIFALCIHSVPVAAQVVGVRSFSGPCAVDQSVDVRLDIDVGAQVPNGVIVVEKLPAGWTLNSVTPPPSNINLINGEVRWVFFGSSVNDHDLDIHYTTGGGDPAGKVISGDLRYNDPQGEPQIVVIAGDTMCELASCVGDCDGDKAVTIDEILQCIGGTLGGVSQCPACDADGSGTTTVDEIVTGVNNALNGCR